MKITKPRMGTESKAIVRASAKISLLTIISRVLGYSRDVIMAASMGTGMINDIFIAAFKLANLFRTLFAEGSFNATFVPIFSGLLVDKGKQHAAAFAVRMQACLLVALLIFTVAVIIFMPAVIGLTTPGFIGQEYSLDFATKLSRIMFPYLIFISIAAFYGGVLNSVGVFSPFASTSIILNIVMMIGALFASDIEGIAYALAYSVLVAGVLELLWMLYFARKYNMLIVLRKPKITPKVRLAFSRMLPSIVGSGVTQINVWIDMLIVSFIAGGMSYLYYADRIMQLPMALIGTTIGIVMLPGLSKALKSDSKEKVEDMMSSSFSLIMFFALPASVGLIMIGEDIVRILFMRGNFTYESVTNTSIALIAFTIGLPAFSLNKLFTVVFYSHGDTKIPLRCAVMTIILNASISILLLQSMQHAGVALASTISGWVSILYLVYVLQKRSLLYLKYDVLPEILKSAVASVMMGLYIYYIPTLLATLGGRHYQKDFIWLGCMIASSGAIYMLCASLFKSSTFKLLFVSDKVQR